MKQFTAIMFSLALAWMQIIPLSAKAETSSACPKMAADGCTTACCDAACCATTPAPNSKPAPAVPSPSRAQNQISLLAAAVVTLVLPQIVSSSIAFAPVPASLAPNAPLYARDCALRL